MSARLRHVPCSLEHLYRTLCILGLAIGAFFSLMSASFAYEDPLLRQHTQASLNTRQKASEIFKEMGRGMWRSGKGFGKVGALFAGVECVIESVSVPPWFAQDFVMFWPLT